MLTKLFVSTVAVSALCVGAPVFYITTGQQQQQSQIDINHTSSWVITPTSNWELGGGRFVMKDGRNTTAEIYLAIWQGSTDTGVELARVTLTNTLFCAGFANCQSYDLHSFYFNVAVPLMAATTYYVALRSDAVDAQDEAYFIKQPGTYTITDQFGNPATFPDTVPEPWSFGLCAAGVIAIALQRRRLAAPKR